MKGKQVAYIGVVFAEIFWAASFIFTNEALKVFTPVSVVVMRITVATLLLLAFCTLRRELEIPTWKETWLFVLAGIFQPFIYFILEAYGLQYTNSPNTASLILALGPLLSPFVAWLLIRERITVHTVIGLFICAGGIAIIVTVGQELKLNVTGVVLLAMAAMTTIFYTICLRKVHPRFKPATIVFWVDVTSLVFFLPAWAVMDRGKPFIMGQVIEAVKTGGIMMADEGRAIGAIVILAVFCSVVSYICFCNAVRYIGVAKANAFSNLIPALTPVCVWIFTGEMMEWNKYMGILVVIGGLFLSQNGKKDNEIKTT